MNLTIEQMGQTLDMRTVPGLFSPSHADFGTLAMLTQVRFEPGQKVLDLGCGWGLVGVLAAKICGEENVFFSDVDPAAVETARENARRNGVGGASFFLSDGFHNIPETGFDLILTNPPYQTDFSVAKSFIEKGFNRLKVGGWMFVVVKREKWYRNKMTSVFGGVRCAPVDGYFVLSAQRRDTQRGIRHKNIEGK